jgi:P27 family predicted phage terminase small subunit
MPGPAPTPTELLKARGNPHANKRQSLEPDCAVAAPDCPEFLSPEARQHWDYIVPRLLARRTLSDADVGLLAMMCAEYAAYVEAYEHLAKLKAAAKKRKRDYIVFHGHVVDHPRVLMKSAFERYVKAAVQFGLSPSAKARVHATPEKKKPKAQTERPALRIAG